MSSYESVKQAITFRITRSSPDLLIQYGPQRVLDAIEDVASMYGDIQLDEIGSSDVSCWVKSVEDILKGG